MDRREFLGWAALGLLPMSLRADDSKFEQFLNDQQGGFASFQAKLDKDFQAYQRIQSEEFQRYQQRVNALWGDKNIGDAKILVTYSKDLKTRTTVNYETGLVLVETLGSQAELKQALVSIAHATSQTLYQNSELEQRVQARLQQGATSIKTAQPNATPIIADMLTGKAQATDAEIDQALAKVEKKSRHSEAHNALGAPVLRLTVPLGLSALSKKADQYRDTVASYANKEQINAALVLAVMHTESHFNPLARSAVPAYGLMQIVPTSAGKDASAHVYGRAALLSPSYLYQSDNNIKMGCAYLHLLQHNYLSEIRSPESKLYCTIAAYNTGAGNVARAFTGKNNIKNAALLINKMQPNEVYRHLTVNLPYQETRHYLKQVTGRYQAYLV